MQAKMQAVNMMAKMQRTIRQENESLIALKGMCPDKKIPKGLLTAGAEAIKDGKFSSISDSYLALAQFELAEELDVVNEARPSLAHDVKSIKPKTFGFFK